MKFIREKLESRMVHGRHGYAMESWIEITQLTGQRDKVDYLLQPEIRVRHPLHRTHTLAVPRAGCCFRFNGSFKQLGYAMHYRSQLHNNVLNLFTQPPSSRRQMRICYAVVFCFFLFFVVFFVVVFPSTKTMRQPFSGTAERIFMKLLPNDTRENVV